MGFMSRSCGVKLEMIRSFTDKRRATVDIIFKNVNKEIQKKTRKFIARIKSKASLIKKMYV